MATARLPPICPQRLDFSGMPKKNPVRTLIALSREAIALRQASYGGVNKPRNRIDSPKAAAWRRHEEDTLAEELNLALRAYIQSTLVDENMRARELSHITSYRLLMIKYVLLRKNRWNNNNLFDQRFYFPQCIYSFHTPDAKKDWFKTAPFRLRALTQYPKHGDKWYESGHSAVRKYSTYNYPGAAPSTRKVNMGVTSTDLAAGVTRVEEDKETYDNDPVYLTRLPPAKHASALGQQNIAAAVLSNGARGNALWLKLPASLQHGRKPLLFPPRRPIDQELDTERFLSAAFNKESTLARTDLPLDIQKTIFYWTVKHVSIADRRNEEDQILNAYDLTRTEIQHFKDQSAARFEKARAAVADAHLDTAS